MHTVPDIAGNSLDRFTAFFVFFVGHDASSSVFGFALSMPLPQDFYSFLTEFFMLYVIADLHLSTGAGTNKSMEVFGARWAAYTERLEKNWRAVITPEDSVVIPGDISWALTLEEAVSDLLFLDALPGHKYIGKGNHDFWWSTAAKTDRFFAAHGISSLSLLNNNAWLCEDFILCGTRGWFQDEAAARAPQNADYDKLIAREAIRLSLSLAQGQALQKQHPDTEILAFLHFPPVWNGQECRPLLDVLHRYGVHRCYFGHIHGNYTVPASFLFEDIRFALISADFLHFAPRPILPDFPALP